MTVYNMVVNGVLAGSSAASASLLGKLSGIGDWETPSWIIIKIILISCMISCNAFMWTCFVRSLQISKSSLPPTIISSTTNYICSAIAGYFFFNEVTSLLWWSGTCLIIMGLVLICKSQKVELSPHKKHN